MAGQRLATGTSALRQQRPALSLPVISTSLCYCLLLPALVCHSTPLPANASHCLSLTSMAGHCLSLTATAGHLLLLPATAGNLLLPAVISCCCLPQRATWRPAWLPPATAFHCLPQQAITCCCLPLFPVAACRNAQRGARCGYRQPPLFTAFHSRQSPAAGWRYFLLLPAATRNVAPGVATASHRFSLPATAGNHLLLPGVISCCCLPQRAAWCPARLPPAVVSACHATLPAIWHTRQPRQPAAGLAPDARPRCQAAWRTFVLTSAGYRSGP